MLYYKKGFGKLQFRNKPHQSTCVGQPLRRLSKQECCFHGLEAFLSVSLPCEVNLKIQKWFRAHNLEIMHDVHPPIIFIRKTTPGASTRASLFSREILCGQPSADDFPIVTQPRDWPLENGKIMIEKIDVLFVSTRNIFKIRLNCTEVVTIIQLYII